MIRKEKYTKNKRVFKFVPNQKMRKQKNCHSMQSILFLNRRKDTAVVLLEVWLVLVSQQAGVFLPVVSYHKVKSEVTSYVREHTHFRIRRKMCIDTEVYGDNIGAFTTRRS